MAQLDSLRELSADALYLVLETFHALSRQNRVDNLEVLADCLRTRQSHSGVRLGFEITKKTLSGNIRKVERSLGDLRLFDRPESGPGGWKLFRDAPQSSQVEQIMHYIESIVEGFHQLERYVERFTVSIGCSRTLGSWLVPEVCRQVKEELAAEAKKTGEPSDFDIVFTHGTPQAIRNQGMGLGLFDIVVASCHVEERPDREIVGTVRLPMHLLINRRDPLTVNDNLVWEQLNGYTVLLQSLLLNPQPLYPFDYFPPGLLRRRVESYAEAFATVQAAGSTGKVSCLAFPHAHSPEQRLGLRAYSMPGLTSVPVGVIRPAKAKERTDAKKEPIVDRLARRILARLKTLDEEIEKDDFAQFFLHPPSVTYHVTRRPANVRAYDWLRGELRNISLGSDGRFEADHVVFDKFHGNRPIEYAVVGHINFEGGLYQVSWRGTKQAGDTARIVNEDYSVNLMFRDPALPWMGAWLGKSIWDNTPDLGYFVVCDQPGMRDLSPDDWDSLADLVCQHDKANEEFSPLALHLPAREESGESKRVVGAALPAIEARPTPINGLRS